MKTKAFLLGICLALSCLTISGCAGNELKLALFGDDGSKKEITFPNGTTLGSASTDQAQALAKILVDSHNQHMEQFAKLNQKADENLATARQALGLLENMAEQQGTGEITLFFATGSARLAKGSLEYNRLVRFVDYLSREAKGRDLHLVLVGSASATGNPKRNLKLSRRRAQTPVDIIDKYLVNVPHDYYKVYGLGDMYSPQKAAKKVHLRYQNVRLIAVYATDKLPKLPDE